MTDTGKNDARPVLVEAFSTLAACFDIPTPELAARLSTLAESLSSLAPEAARLAARAAGAAPGEADMAEARIEYSRLFVGPFSLPAPPFGSVYLESDGRVMGPSTMDARRMYQELGMDLADDFHNPPDHVVAELEFMAWLMYREIEAETHDDAEAAARAREARALFAARHVKAWFDEFLTRVEQNTDHPFYASLVPLGRAIMMTDAS